MENFSYLDHWQQIMQEHGKWRKEWFTFASDETLGVDKEKVQQVLAELMDRLRDNYPYFHPCYAGQMLKPAHPIAVLGYWAAMLINPNNHALDGGKATSELEKEVVREIAQMFGYNEYLGHLTSGGTIANLEGLWVARHIHPEKAIIFSKQSHYTHGRMCEVIQAPCIEVGVDYLGKIDVEEIERLCKENKVGTVVATLGTTGWGALDPLDKLLELAQKYKFRIHVDTAYGGFFRILAEEPEPIINAKLFRLISECDSIAIDPHKHGLQPYGCGCVLFRNPEVGRFYKHDSPYTYFTSDDLHLGEISLECSRAGAAAAALWTTLRCFPLRYDKGLGPVLRKCRMAALEWAKKIRETENLHLMLEPELDIVVFFPQTAKFSAMEVSQCADRVFRQSMEDQNHPIFLSKLRVQTSLLCQHYPNLENDSEWTTLLRSVLMKPEHGNYIEYLDQHIKNYIKQQL